MRYLKNKLSWAFIFTLVLTVSQLTAFADDPGLPGDGCDPYEQNPNASDYCTTDTPLDTWVFWLVFLVIVFTAWYYYKQKKSLRTL